MPARVQEQEKFFSWQNVTTLRSNILSRLLVVNCIFRNQKKINRRGADWENYARVDTQVPRLEFPPQGKLSLVVGNS
jgi:hypothetical protein